jgi:hypothetical protein
VTTVQRYLELGLRLGKHDEELVDAYYGPDEIAAAVDAEELREPAALAEDARELLADVASDPWLAAHVQALLAHARKLTGEELTYAEEGNLVYGIEPRWHDEEPFRVAATLLAEALPGSGDLRSRLARWYEETAVPAEILSPALLDAAAELRGLATERIGLPEGEEFELELVTDERWLGYARYLGNLRTQISVNTDLPLPASVLVPLVAHEIYGGHHTHHAWQEVDLVRGRGELEWTIVLLWSPAAVISEGIATAAPEIVAGEGAQELAAAVLGRLGFDYDGEAGARVAEAGKKLAGVSANVGMLLHDRGASTEEAREYAATWSFQPDERLDRMVASQAARLSAVYSHTYWQGYELVDAYAQGDPWRFRELMTARVLPADLGG